MRTHLTVEQRQLALRLKARGLSLREIGPQVGCSHQGVGADRAAGLAAAGPPGRLGARAGAADPGGPGGDHPGPACRGVVHRDRRPAGQGGLHGVAGGGRQRRPGRVPGMAGASACPRAGPAAQAPKLACPELAAQVTSWLAEWWSPVQISARLRIEHPGDPMMQYEPRDDLPGPVRAGPRRAAPGAGPLPALRPGQTPPPRPRWPVRAYQGHGDDQRPSRRG